MDFPWIFIDFPWIFPWKAADDFPSGHFFVALSCAPLWCRGRWSQVNGDWLFQNSWKNYIPAGWWFGTCFIIIFFHILGIVTPTDFHIFQRGLNHQPENCIPELLGKKPSKIKMTRNELLKRGWDRLSRRHKIEELPISSEDMCRTWGTWRGQGIP